MKIIHLSDLHLSANGALVWGKTVEKKILCNSTNKNDARY